MGYIFDDSFGNANIGFSQTQEMQFMRGTGAIGRGRYRDYNPSGPIPVDAQYDWTGAQLLQFKSDWENPLRLNYGASWFEISLPAFVPPYRQEALPTNLQLTVAAGANIAAGYDATNSVGSISPAVLYPRTLDKVGLTLGDALIITPVDNRRLAGSDELILWFHDGGALSNPRRTLTWDPVNERYELTGVTGALKTYLIGAVGTTIPISISVPTTAVDSYPGTTFLNANNTTTIGYVAAQPGNIISRSDFFDFSINRIALNVNTQTVQFALVDNKAIPGLETIYLKFPNLGGDFLYRLDWDYVNARYENNSVPGLANYLTNNVGTYIPFNFLYRTPKFGSYIAHFRAPYQQQLLGGNFWRVTLPLEIDVSPQLTYAT